MKLIYATTNAGKVASLQETLGNWGYEITQFSEDIPESRSASTEVIAREKAMFAYDKVKQPVVALDAGFFMPEFGDFPGTFTNWMLQTIGLEGLLKLADGSKRLCEFRHSLAYMDETLDEPVIFTDAVKGILAHEKLGTYDSQLHWSKLSLVFIPEDDTRTLAQLTPEEYKSRTHKKQLGRYYDQFHEWMNVRRQ